MNALRKKRNAAHFFLLKKEEIIRAEQKKNIKTFYLLQQIIRVAKHFFPRILMLYSLVLVLVIIR